MSKHDILTHNLTYIMPHVEYYIELMIICETTPICISKSHALVTVVKICETVIIKPLDVTSLVTGNSNGLLKKYSCNRYLFSIKIFSI